MEWYLYILKCSDGSLYTGITNNLERRIEQHNLGKGAKSLRGKLPVCLVYKEQYPTQIEAAKREREIKSWKKIYKEKLVNKGKSQ